MPPRKANLPPGRASTRASTRASKSLTRKRAQPSSQSATQLSKKPKIRKSKTRKPKPRPTSSITAISEPRPSARNEAQLIDISDEADYEKEDEEKEEDWEEGAEADVIDKEQEKEQQQQEARPLKFQTTWKALSGKEQLPGVRSGYYTKDTLFMTDIEEWKQKVLRDLQPRSFRVVSLVAIASHEKCRQSDEFPQELGSILDLDPVLRCLEEWHTQWPQRALTLRVILRLLLIQALRSLKVFSIGLKSGEYGGRNFNSTPFSSHIQRSSALL